MIEQTCRTIAKASLMKGYTWGVATSAFIFLIGFYVIFTLQGVQGLTKNGQLRSKIGTLIVSNDGIVTVVDLLAAVDVSPQKASKFLINFAQNLGVEAEVEEQTGTRFYRFRNAKQITKLIDY